MKMETNAQILTASVGLVVVL